MSEKSYVVTLFTVTVAACTALSTPLLKHVSVYVPEVSGDSVAVPATSFGPDHAPDAVQDVASLDDHVSVTDSPFVMVVGFADSETVGTGVGTGVGAGVGASCTTITTSSPLVNSVSLTVRLRVYAPAVGNAAVVLALVGLPKETGAGPLRKRQPRVRELPVGNLSSLTVPVTTVPTVPVADKARD